MNKLPLIPEPPKFTLSEAAVLLAEHFSIVGALIPLVSDHDQNFRVNTATGDFVFKIANVAEDKAVLDLQNQALLHLARYAPELSVPKVQMTRNGDMQTAVTIDGREYYLRLLSYLVGGLFREAEQLPVLLTELGDFLGRLDRALQGFYHPAMFRELCWDVKQADFILDYSGYIADPRRRTMVENFYQNFVRRSQAELPKLPAAVIHNDANDYNVLVDAARPTRIAGLIDFGDMVYTCRINELAVALAYALMGQADLLGAARKVIAAYHAINPLQDAELAVLYDLIAVRLCTSVVISSWRCRQQTDNDYLLVSQQPAFALLERWQKINPQVAYCNFRYACGWSAVATAPLVSDYLQSIQTQFAPVLGRDLAVLRKRVLSWTANSIDSAEAAAGVAAYTELLWQRMAQQSIDVYIGKYLEDRHVYDSDNFNTENVHEKRSVHLGSIYSQPRTRRFMRPWQDEY